MRYVFAHVGPTTNGIGPTITDYLDCSEIQMRNGHNIDFESDFEAKLHYI